jgi:hypothetical protein
MLSLLYVERVVNALPQLHLTLMSLYCGCISAFMSIPVVINNLNRALVMAGVTAEKTGSEFYLYAIF